MRNPLPFFKSFFRKKENEGSLRETLEELIEEEEIEDTSIVPDEREMLTNILRLRDLTAEDIMIARADIIAIPHTSTLDEIKTVFKTSKVLRLPVYRQTLDDIFGYIHLQDLLAEEKGEFKISPHIRKIDFIAPSMRVLDLLVKMRSTGEKAAIVVDEYGGVDGLITMGGLIEEIVGDIHDSPHGTLSSYFLERPDGVVVVDGRMDIEELEKKVGPLRTKEEKEDDIDTVGGLVLSLVDRIPKQGERIPHSSGREFEILEEDSRRIKRVGIHGLTPHA